MTFDCHQIDADEPRSTFSNTGEMPLAKIIAIAWAAGFVDGEGCICISKTQQKNRPNPSYRLVVTIVQNHLGSLKHLAAALDLRWRYYEVKRSDSMNRDAFIFNICDQHAYRALKVLLPYLVRKGPEARVAMKAYDLGKMTVHPGPKGHSLEVWKARERYYKKLRNMK